MTEPVSRHFLSHRLRLHYIDWGNEGAPPLILLHGGNDHARSWDDVARRLRGRFHIVAPDLRGHGDSDWSPDGNYSVTAHVIDLAELIRQLGGGPVPVVAHSFGARVALRHAGIFPETVSRLVAIEGLFGTATTAAPADRIRDYYSRQRTFIAKAPPRYATLEEAGARMRVVNPRLSDALALHLARHGTRQDGDGRYRWKFDPLARPRTPVELTPDEELAIFAAITCPTLLVQGRDSWARIDEGHPGCRAIPDARLATFDDAGHWVQHDRLDAFVEEVSAFLSPA
ncbi:alpha/beta hydrolase [Sphingomonas sp. CGMCC 1.13654]|uniref:Alpha/beta hydrolase n=1 Tax=Sphingomonas chungangi TaxID=2683589 RepID=A0A838LCI5_9SPHN|nr:alpha/beta hydrolase [Sphingomonas chungangi]MBA2936445.1 alpha/beta hydrolase [Sphingomonas chungangi]MVW55830.1 alpha/beta fold hydrolase [Sphingomonas chungangi]